MHIVAYQQPTLVRYLPAPEADHAVTQDMGPAPIREQRIHEQQVRMNGDSDHQFEVNTRMYPYLEIMSRSHVSPIRSSARRTARRLFNTRDQRTYALTRESNRHVSPMYFRYHVSSLL